MSIPSLKFFLSIKVATMSALYWCNIQKDSGKNIPSRNPFQQWGNPRCHLWYLTVAHVYPGETQIAEKTEKSELLALGHLLWNSKSTFVGKGVWVYKEGVNTGGTAFGWRREGKRMTFDLWPLGTPKIHSESRINILQLVPMNSCHPHRCHHAPLWFLNVFILISWLWFVLSKVARERWKALSGSAVCLHCR